MQYNTIQANSYLEAIEKMKNQYGPSARPMTCRNIRYGGFLGLFKTEGVEVTCYLAADSKAGGTGSVETEKKKILENLNKNQTMQIILKEIQALKKDLSVSRPKEEPLHGSIMRIRDLLELNDFSRDFIDQITVKLRQEFSLETLEDFDAVKERVIEWIGEGIKIYSPKDSAEGKPRIITIIGPTGVGKTTTVAKLAAIYGLERGSSSGLQVRMVTIDNYKIAAKKQIETYAEIMQIPVSFAESRSDLEKVLDLYNDVDVILIDTIGRSPTDLEKLGEMQAILNACGSVNESHLAVSATTKTIDIEEIFRQFEPFNYQSVILTKLDETSGVGNIISLLSKHRKPLSYFTDGQMVPQDIEDASVSRLLMCLEGFRVDRDYIESKFDQKVVDTNRG